MTELMNREQLAARLGVAKQTLARWAVEGKGPVMHAVGRRVMYSETDVTAWLATRRRKSTTQTAAGRVA
jgi:predicted site-specific integrase-resolvase